MRPETEIVSTEEEMLFDRRLVSQADTGPQSDLTANIEALLQRMSHAQEAAHVVCLLSHCSDVTGGYVLLRPEYRYVPVLLGNDQLPIPLYQFVEVLDEAVNYDRLRRELPALSYSQINGAISFLRKVSQYNPNRIDFDQIEDEEEANDPAFLEELRKALADEETSRVLNNR